jgi:hypothetical protein
LALGLPLALPFGFRLGFGSGPLAFGFRLKRLSIASRLRRRS